MFRILMLTFLFAGVYGNAASLPSAQSSKAKCLPKAIGTTPDLPKFRGKYEGRQEFINTMAPLAVHIQTVTGLPASILLGQLIMETAGGTSVPASENKNYGGLSCAFDEPPVDAPSKRSLSRPEQPWTDKVLPVKIWSDVEYTYQHRCGNLERGKDENGRYVEFKHVYDSVLDVANTILERPSYNDPEYKYKRDELLSQKMKEWGVTFGIRESASRLKKAKSTAEKTKMRDNIIKMLQGVYAPKQKDCPSCPESNNEYEANLRGAIKFWELERFDNMKTCFDATSSQGRSQKKPARQ